MKNLTLIAALAVFATGAYAQGGKKAPTEINCAVMKSEKANIKTATSNKLFSDYKGRRYYFCCTSCKPAFDKDPKKYANSPSVPTPKK